MKVVLIDGCQVPQIVIPKNSIHKFSMAQVPIELAESGIETKDRLVHSVTYGKRTYHMICFDTNLWIDMETGDVVTIEVSK
jgi:hypothetical protein